MGKFLWRSFCIHVTKKSVDTLNLKTPDILQFYEMVSFLLLYIFSSHFYSLFLEHLLMVVALQMD